jgi:site-specific DNA-methyltransferase (adenine-specific)
MISFMWNDWDKVGSQTTQEWHKTWLSEAYRVLESGGVIKVFSGSRTFHRLAAAMCEAGFAKVRLEAWAYGSGFPKSKNLALFIDKAAGAVGNRGRAIPMASTHFATGKYAEGGEKLTSNRVEAYRPATPEAKTWDGWGTALKPSWEPVLTGRKPA